MHRPIALHCMPYSITMWAYLSELLIKDSHKTSKFDGKTTIPRAPSHVLTHYCHGEVYGNIAVRKMADLVAVSL